MTTYNIITRVKLRSIKMVLATMALMAVSGMNTLAQTVESPKLVWHDPLALGQNVITGRVATPDLIDGYGRLPRELKAKVRPEVWWLGRQSAGLGIDFHTNATDIEVRYTVSGELAMHHMPITGVSGVDLYATGKNGETLWCAPSLQLPHRLDRVGGEGCDTLVYRYHNIDLSAAHGAKGYDYHLSLPLYNEVTSLEIGVTEGYDFGFRTVSEDRPIVVYGTSIAQGACASRPGMAWTSILQRELGHDVVNLGFSGNGRLEAELFDLMANTPARAYVIDCMPNMTPQRLCDSIVMRLVSGIEQLRKSTDAPILLVEHNGYTGDRMSQNARGNWQRVNAELLRAWQELQRRGVKGLHYLSHDAIGQQMDDMVEGVHPSDMGMRRIATAYATSLRRILGEDCMERTVFTPITQQRDPYDWQDRHRRVMEVNRTEPPQVVLIGNSITHYWAGLPTGRLVRGTDSWNDLWKGKVAHNLGFGWDRIENALWRIYHGELDGYEAEKVLLLLGTNNVDYNTDEEIADGIAEVVRAVRARQPKAAIYVCSVLPRADRFARIAPLNRTIQTTLALQGADATYLDLSPAVLDGEGKLRSELFSDGLHPTQEGYREIAKRLKELLQ